MSRSSLAVKAPSQKRKMQNLKKTKKVRKRKAMARRREAKRNMGAGIQAARQHAGVYGLGQPNPGGEIDGEAGFQGGVDDDRPEMLCN